MSDFQFHIHFLADARQFFPLFRFANKVLFSLNLNCTKKLGKETHLILSNQQLSQQRFIDRNGGLKQST